MACLRPAAKGFWSGVPAFSLRRSHSPFSKNACLFVLSASLPLLNSRSILGQPDQAFEWLTQALRERDGGVVDVRAGRLFKPLRKDRRYEPAASTDRAVGRPGRSFGLQWTSRQGRAQALRRKRIDVEPCKPD